MRRGFLLTFVLLHLSAAIGVSQAVEFPDNQTEAKVQLTRCGDLLFVPVKISGGDPVLFLLDTGAAAIDVSEDFAKEHEFSVNGENVVNEKHVRRVAIPEIEVGGVKLWQATASVLDLSLFSDSSRKNQKGTIGGSFLKNMPFTINWSQATLTLYKQKPKPQLDSLEVPIWVFGSRPYIQATPGGGISGWFAIDTGAEAGFSLESSFARWNLDWLAPLRYRVNPGNTFDARLDYFACHFSDSQIAGISIPQCESYYPVKFQRDTAFPPPAHGLIGQEILKNFQITFDYRSGRAWINKETGIPAEWNDRQFDPRAADLSGLTPLMRAAEMGRVEEVARFLAAGVPIDAKGMLGKTALHFATNAAVVEALITAGAKVDAHADAGFTPLHRAAWLGNVEVSRQLLKHASEINAVDDTGATPLIFAAGSGNAELVSMLVNAGANLEAVNSAGTALSAACRFGHVEVAKVLLDAGASIDNSSRSARLLNDAAAWGSLELVNLLISHGVVTNARSPDGTTPLILAAFRGNTDIVKGLLNHGADPSMNKDNGTALHYALFAENQDCAKILYYNSSPATTKPAAAQTDVEQIEFPKGKTQIQIPLRRAGDRLLVPIRINGADAGLFFLDTGASDFVIDSDFAQNQKLPSVTDALIGGKQPPFVAVSELEIGGIKLSRTFAQTIEVAKRPILPGVRGPHGIIGGDFLKHIPFAINWSAPSLTLYKENYEVPQDAVRVPLWLLGNRPAINLSLADGVSGWFALQTGAEFGCELTHEFGQAHASWLNEILASPEYALLERAAPIKTYRAGVRDVKIAELGVSPSDLFWSDQPQPDSASSPPAAGSVGLQMLKYFDITFDYKNRVAWIHRNANNGIPSQWSNADFNAQSADFLRFTPLMRAARMGRVDNVKRFIAAGADVNAKDYFANTALHFAAENADAAVTRILLENGAALEAENAAKTTPLMVAASRGSTAVVKLLLSKNANIISTDRIGRSALLFATATRHTDIMAAIIKARLGFSPATSP